VTDQRKYKRFELRLPLELVNGASYAGAKTCETENLSSGGVLFQCGDEYAVGDAIEYRITLPSREGERSPVQLLCRGKVIRRSEGRQIAATLERYEFVRSK